MAGDLIRFVDSIAASPTVRLNVNDEVTWWVKSFNAPPPRLRRSMSSNAMRDGAHMSASNYEPRTITLELEVRTSTQDATATAMQTLWRELDRVDNFLMYQPTGATKPVFFRLYRSDASQLEDVHSQAAMRRITIDLLAEPFALGLKETLGPYTVSNDPAAGTNPTRFDVTGVLGDVAAPVILWDSPSVNVGGRILAASHCATTPPYVWLSAEAATLGSDTTNPGGGPDAAMSGTGANNYRRTSFNTVPQMDSRLTFNAAASTFVGRYRAIAFVRRSGTTSAIELLIGTDGAPGSNGSVTMPLVSGARLAVDMGIFSLFNDADSKVGYSPSANSLLSIAEFSASRSGGSDALDWDGVLLVPVGDQLNEAAQATSLTVRSTVYRYLAFDAVRESITPLSAAADPTTGAATFTSLPEPFTGAVPMVCPGLASRFIYVQFDGTTYASAVTSTSTVTGAYWPRYLHVRPSST